MPTKPKLLIASTRRLRDGRLLSAAIDHQGADVAQDLAKRRTQTVLEALGVSPQSLPDGDFQDRYQEGVKTLVELIGSDLDFAMEAVEASALHLYTLRSQTAERRQERDDRARRIESAIRVVRSNFKLLFPTVPTHRFGFVDERPTSAFDTLRRLGQIVDQFERLGDQLPELPTSRIDILGLVEDLKEDRELLAETLDALDDLKRRTDTALIERNRLHDHLDRMLLHGARIFEALCRLAGEDELADRVRPKVPRGGVVTFNEDQVPGDDDSPDDDSPGEGSPGDETPGDETPGEGSPGDASPPQGSPTASSSEDTEPASGPQLETEAMAPPREGGARRSGLQEVPDTRC